MARLCGDDLMHMQRRAAIELRAEGDGRTLVGTCAPYGVVTNLGQITEQYARGAFAETLTSDADTLLLLDHALSQLLARRANGSLELTDGPDGLQFRATLIETSLADDVIKGVKAGLYRGASCGFYITRESWNGQQRTIEGADLREISVVSANAAYTATSVSVRSRPGASLPAARARRRVLAGL
jgi:HK97 family phage prohead protease